MADNWTRLANTTIADYMRGEEVNILRNRKLLALLMSRGRISMNHAGTEMDWKVRYKRAQMVGYADGDTLSFARKERHKTAKLGWRGYSTTDSITKMEQLQNKGTTAIINIYAEMATLLKDDLEENFGDELYVNGNAAGNQKRMHGFESWCASSGPSAGGYVGLPSATYAGLSCVLGNYGGAWSINGGNVTWPIGTGDPQYDFWSPLLVNYTSASFGGTPTWAANAAAAVRFAITHQGRNKSKTKMMDVITLDPELYRQFLNSQEARQQIQVQRNAPTGLVALGFADVINYDGCDITREYGVPSGTGYGVPVMDIELCSLQGQLFVPEGPDFDISTKSYRLSLDFFGNMKANPRNFVKFVALGGA
jgi:hypothetical protein